MKIFSVRKLNEALNDPRVRAAGVAEVAGISTQTLWTLRKGHKKPKFDTLAAIAQALNKPLDFFMEDEDIVNQQRLALETRNAG